MTGSENKNTKQQAAVVEPNSPYYLHPSNNPKQVYVSELLNKGNYTKWMNDISNALLTKNKIGFIDGTISMSNVNSHDLSHWMRCNAMVKGWLKSAMDKDLCTSVRYAKMACDIWSDLQEQLGKGSAPRAYELRQAVALLRKEYSTVPTYYTKLKSIWDEMQTISPWPKYECGRCKCNLEKQLVEMKECDPLYDFSWGWMSHLT